MNRVPLVKNLVRVLMVIAHCLVQKSIFGIYKGVEQLVKIISLNVCAFTFTPHSLTKSGLIAPFHVKQTVSTFALSCLHIR